MADHNSGFRIGPEEDPISRGAGAVRSSGGVSDRRRLERLNRRLTWLAILLPLLVLLVAGAIYHDLRGRLGRTPETDFATAAQVAGLQERIASLDQALQDKEGPLNEAFLVFERTTATLREDIEQLGIRMDQLKTGKAEIADVEVARKELGQRIQAVSDRVTAVSEAITPLQEDMVAAAKALDTLRTSVAGLEESMAGVEARVDTQIAERTAGLAETQVALQDRLDGVDQTTDQLRTELDEVADQVIEALKVVENAAGNQNDVDAALAAQKREMDQTVTTLNREINANDTRTRSLRRDLDALQRRVESLARQRQRPLGTPERGRVLEQDLQ
jgi:chromosome segregation ATPase